MSLSFNLVAALENLDSTDGLSAQQPTNPDMSRFDLLDAISESKEQQEIIRRDSQDVSTMVEAVGSVSSILEQAAQMSNVEPNDVDFHNVALEHHAKRLGLSGKFKLETSRGKVTEASMEGIGDWIMKIVDLVRQKASDLIRNIKMYFERNDRTFMGLQNRLNKVYSDFGKNDRYQPNATLNVNAQHVFGLVVNGKFSEKPVEDAGRFTATLQTIATEFGDRIIEQAEKTNKAIPNLPLDGDVNLESFMKEVIKDFLTIKDFETMKVDRDEHLGTIRFEKPNYRPSVNVAEWADPLIHSAEYPGFIVTYKPNDRRMATARYKTIRSLSPEEVEAIAKNLGDTASYIRKSASRLGEAYHELVLKNQEAVGYLRNRAQAGGHRLSGSNITMVNMFCISVVASLQNYATLFSNTVGGLLDTHYSLLWWMEESIYRNR